MEKVENQPQQGKFKQILEKFGIPKFVRDSRTHLYYVFFHTILMPADYSGQRAADAIYERIMSKKPTMICRYGKVEINAMKEMALVLNKEKEYSDSNFSLLETNAGFFPVNYASVKKFYERMRKDSAEVDMLGSWCSEEIYFKDLIKNSKKIVLRDITPFFSSNPWSRALEGKKVLVISPFDETIKKQYKKREKLFNNPLILPKFELITLRSVNSIKGNDVGFKDWFAALKHMENQISKIDFDVAILGCGAYGFPLAAHIKKMGKIGIHLGGSTQLLFGVKGKRWEEHNFKLINEHWVRPSKSERPKNYKKVEGGTYW